MYPLHGFLTAFILQKIFSIPTDPLLLLFLHLCKELRNFCGFTKVPDASLISRFKHDFKYYIELYVTEYNPKTLNSLIKRPKAYYKDMPDVNPYKMTFWIMSSYAASCPDAKQVYTNGYFCYTDKLAILTNGLGIVRLIAFTDDENFKFSHPDLIVEKKIDSPDEDKPDSDISTLTPVLKHFFALHPDFHPDTFLGDSAFDCAELYET